MAAVNIYAPRFAQLLLLWAASGNAVDWTLVEKHWKVVCGAVALASRTNLVQGPQRRVRLRRILDLALTARGLMTTHVVYIRVPVLELVPLARVTVSNAIHKSMHPEAAAWCMSRLRIVHGDVCSHIKRWTHAKDVKALKWNMLPRIPREQLMGAISGKDMGYVDVSWDVLVLFNDKALEKIARDCVAKAVAKIPAVHLQKKKLDVRAHAAVNKYCRRRDGTWKAYAQHTKNMSCRREWSIVPDDKNKKHAWKMPTHVYQILLAFFVLLFSNWVLTQVFVQSANELCLHTVMTLVPQQLHVFLGLRQGILLVPCAYATVKSKCFSQDGRTCFRQGHSCVRKVISFGRWPKKSCWRMISRGLQTALQRCCFNWQVWRMKDAPATLRRKVSSLFCPEDPRVCQRCRKSKPPLCATVHDAGQFIECVTLQEALRAAKEILDMAFSATSCFYVCIFRRKKKAGFLCPRSFPSNARKFKSFNFAEVFLVFAAEVSIPYVIVGSHVVQLSTLPIGGLMSMIAAALVLCLNEHNWLQHKRRWAENGFLTIPNWSQQVASLRYVGDLLQLSACYCVSCQNDIPGLVYNVPFDLSHQGTQVTWTDLHIHLDPFSIGMASKPFVLKPPLAADAAYLRSWVTGKFSRWHQVGLCNTNKTHEVCRIVWSILEHGFAWSQVRKLVFLTRSERFYPRAFTVRN